MFVYKINTVPLKFALNQIMRHPAPSWQHHTTKCKQTSLMRVVQDKTEIDPASDPEKVALDL